MKLQPVGNRVLVKLDKMKQEVGGIFLPDFDRDKINIGTVIELGTGKINKKGKQIPFSVSVGDKVILSNTLDRITLNEEGNVYDIYRQDEVIGVINE